MKIGSKKKGFTPINTQKMVEKSCTSFSSLRNHRNHTTSTQEKQNRFS